MMETPMIDGFIYTVRSVSRPDLVYYGSTIQKLCHRMSGHRDDYRRFITGKSLRGGTTSFQIIALGDAYIELVEAVRVPSKQHLRALEGQYQRREMCVNKQIAGRTHKEAVDAYNKTPTAKAQKAAYRNTPEFKATSKARSAARNATPEAKAYHHARYLARKAQKAAAGDL